ncbi:putative reverse transcriptase domain-containing protein [Tanacetum coccineum]
MSSASSAISYTSVYTDPELGRVFWGADDEEISDGGISRVIVYGYDGLPMQPVAPPSLDYIPGPEDPQTSPVPQVEDERKPMIIQAHDPDYVPEPMYPEYIPLEDEHSPGYVAESDPEEDPEEYEDDETEDGPDEAEEDEEDEEEEDHLAPADYAVVVPTDELVSPPEGTEPVIPPPSTDITIRARITVRPQAFISLPPEAEVERLLVMTTPSPSPPISLSPPSTGERLARCMAPPTHSSPPPVPSPLLPPSGCPTQIQTLKITSTQALIDAVTAALPSPPLLPSLYIPPLIDRRDDIPESEQPTRKRLCLSTLSSRYEIGESSTARPTGDRGVDYGFVSTVDVKARRRGISEVGYGIRDTWLDPAEAVPEIAPMIVRDVNTRVTELAKLHEHDTQDLYALLEDAQDSRSRISQRVDMDSQQVDLLMRDRMTLQETELQTYRDHVYVHETHLQAHQTQLQLQGTLIQIRHQVHETRFQMQQAKIAALQETDRRRQAQMVETLCMLRDMSSHGDNRRNVQTTRPCFYTDFMKCQPLNFNGTEGVVGLTRWIEKMESVFNISGCAIKNQVKFATCTLLGAALTWWNGQIRTLGLEAYAMTWEVKGNDVPAYTKRFQELTLICTKFIANETEKVDKYISGLPDNIYGNVKSARPKTLDETIELANDLMDQKLRTYAERQSDNKRKADDSSRNNHGHFAHDCRNTDNTNVTNTQKANGAAPKGNCCFECGAPGHFKRDCPKLKNKDGENGNAQGWVYVVGNAEKRGNASGNLDSNVVTGTFLLNNYYGSILFDTGANRSFISTAFCSLIDIVPTPLDNSYDVELADGKMVGIDTIIRGCTLNFLDHPFHIDLMPVELGSFDIIIGMDWLRKYHAVIAQEYMAKGCQVFLAQISAKKEEDKPEGKQIKDVPIV